MEWAFFVLFIVLLCFGFVLIFGAPYLPTHKKQVELSLDLLDLKKGELFYELGCGDGRLLRRAALRGYRGVGYELNPLLYLVARFYTYRFRSLVQVRYGNFWAADLSNADGVYTFLLDRFMPKLDKKLSQELKPGVRLVSYTFKIPGKKPIRTKSGIFVYKY